jgi:surface protein
MSSSPLELVYDVSSNYPTITLSLTNGGSNIVIDWGDGVVEPNPSYPYKHSYNNTGIFNVSITGTGVTGLDAHIDIDRVNSQAYLIACNSFGEIGLTNLNYAFYSAGNLTSVPTSLPTLSSITNMSNMFFLATIFNQDISGWDVSSVTDMTNMFNSATAFNQNLSNWDVSNVTTMTRMFIAANAFNQPLNWGSKTSKVTNMAQMFQEATHFNQDISGWDVSSVTEMYGVFQDATHFNQNLSDWDVSNVTDMANIFYGAIAFNQPLNWGSKTSQVQYMNGIFLGATSFNQDVNGWSISSVTTMNSMFYGATSFNKPLNWNWATNLNNNITMTTILFGATSFNQNLSSWDFTKVGDCENMFDGATSFNNGGQPLTWDVSTKTNLYRLFYNASAFNQDLSSWNVSNVTNMQYMFNNAIAFNQDLSSWNVSNVEDMSYMFNNATSFNQNLGNWDVSKVTNMYGMLDYSNLSIDNYNSTLNGWVQLSLHEGVTLTAAGLVYNSSGITAHNFLTASSPYQWYIYGDIFLQPDTVTQNKPFSLTNYSADLNIGNTYQLFDAFNNPISTTVILGQDNILNFLNVNLNSYGLVSITIVDVTDPQYIYPIASFRINILQALPEQLTPLPFRPSLQPSSNLGMYNRYRGASSVGSRPKYGGASRMYSYAHAQNQQDQVINLFISSIFGIRK